MVMMTMMMMMMTSDDDDDDDEDDDDDDLDLPNNLQIITEQYHTNLSHTNL